MQTFYKNDRKIKKIDFNCDLGQSFGVYKNDVELELLDYVSSVNISCGFHAADPSTIRNTLLACAEKNVAIGAHIGFPDIQGFGYRAMELDKDETEALVIYQVGALASFAKSYGLEIEHVRPHGAMYKLAAENFQFSLNIANAIKKFDKWLIYYGAAGAMLEKVSEVSQVRVAHEIFLDKKYNFDGTVNYDAEDIINTDLSIKRLNLLLNSSELDNIEGGKTPVQVDTIHFSNKALNSVELIEQARQVIMPVPVNYKKAESSGWVE